MEYQRELKIYLAGKISDNDWRDSLLSPEWRSQQGYDKYTRAELPGMMGSSTWTNWLPLSKAVLDRFDYAGPFPCERSSNFDQHGVLEKIYDHYSVDTQIAVNTLCLNAIKNCDFFFAWIDSNDAYGTLVELGYAKALGKQVWVAFSDELEIPNDNELSWSKGIDELWFARRTANIAVKTSTPRQALEHLIKFYGLDTESPIEQLLWVAMPLGLRIAAKAQYRIGKYRADFAFPEVSLAIECDGHEFHKSKGQRTHDAKRDRFFKTEGWQVLRFTGTEIHEDPEACASEIVKECSRLWGGQIPGKWRISLNDLWGEVA